jgi:thiol-disulfide isomerase/thioredoxin
MDVSTLFNVPAYKAPEIIAGGEWFNSQPLKLADLRCKVVLVDFWTYSCINCIRTLPYLEAWYEAYKDSGFVIVGVHSPEFPFEKIAENVGRAVKDRKLTYPVVQDNDMATWRAFSNHYWPAHYLIDKDGRVRREHFGEGEYDETEKAIRLLLAEAGGRPVGSMTVSEPVALPFSRGQTPETYLGYERGAHFANTAEFAADQAINYTLVDDLDSGEWTLGGTWRIGPTETTAEGENNTLRIKFSAKEVYLVMDGPKDAIITMKVDGKGVSANLRGGPDVGAAGRVYLDGARLYMLINLPVLATDATLDIAIPKGVSVNAFTFGG